MDKPPIILEFERVFDIFNEALFNKKLVKVPFAIQIKKKIGLRWVQESKSFIIGADILNVELGEIPGILLHEMIHLYNSQRELTDVTTNQYHNKNFLQVALDVGLVVIKHKTQGWALTSTVYPRNVVERLYIRRPEKDKVKLRNEVFDSIKFDRAIFRSGLANIRDQLKQEKPTKTYFLKYECNCPPPHNSIRSGRRPDGPNALDIQCMNCRSKFECVTDLDSE